MAQAFFPNSGAVVNDALMNIGATDPEGGVTPTTTQRNNALQMFNYLVTAWQAHGMQIWCQKTHSGALTASNADYTVGSGGDYNIQRPLSIQHAYLRNTANDPDSDQEVRIISREEYIEIPVKLETGVPNVLYYDPQYDVPGANSGATAKGMIFLHPVPDATTASNYTLGFVYTRPIQDFSGLTDSIDFPQEWYNALMWNLALALTFSYDVPAQKRADISKMAKDSLDLALSWDRELQSLEISPRYA